MWSVIRSRPPLPRVRGIRSALREGWHVFVAQGGLTLNLSTTTVVLGMIAGNREVGYYSAADKVIRAVTSLLGPVAQALYPHLNNLRLHAPVEMSRLMRKSFAWIALLAAGASLATLVLARPAGLVLWGADFGRSVAILRCLSPLPFLLATINIMGTQTMLVFGMDRALSRVVIAGCAANPVLTAVGSVTLGAVGAAAAAVSINAFMVLGLLYALDRQSWGRVLCARPGFWR